MNTFNPSGLQYLQILGGNQVIYEKSLLINLIFFLKKSRLIKLFLVGLNLPNTIRKNNMQKVSWDFAHSSLDYKPFIKLFLCEKWLSDRHHLKCSTSCVCRCQCSMSTQLRLCEKAWLPHTPFLSCDKAAVGVTLGETLMVNNY